MVSYTQNHDLQLFADNEEPWEHRTDFQTIDTRLPIVDANTNRSGYVAKTNAVFIASDTGDVYIGGGSSWNHLGTIGGSGGGSGGDTLGTASDPINEITNTHYREATTTTTVSGSHTLDISTANVHVLTLTGNTELTLTGDHNSLTTGATVVIQQDSTGGHSLSWGTPIQWAEGSHPSLSRDANARHKLVFDSVAGTWDGAVVGTDYYEVNPNQIDNFEGSGVLASYTGDTTAFSADDTIPVYSGLQSLKTSPPAGSYVHILSTDGLLNYPSRGNTFRTLVHMSNVANLRPAILFGADATDPVNNHYLARIFDGASLRLGERNAGTLSDLNSSTISTMPNDNEWYELRVDWGTDDVITASLNTTGGSQLATVSVTDATFAANSGVGFYAYTSTSTADTSTFDNAQILS